MNTMVLYNTKKSWSFAYATNYDRMKNEKHKVYKTDLQVSESCISCQISSGLKPIRFLGGLGFSCFSNNSSRYLKTISIFLS